MTAIRTLTAPFTRLFKALDLAGRQTYCGDSTQCPQLSYAKGNLNQEKPVRISTWNSCPMPGQAERPKR